MAIEIKSATDGDRKETRGRRSFITILALIQLPITVGLIFFAYFLFTSFKIQGMPIEKKHQ